MSTATLAPVVAPVAPVVAPVSSPFRALTRLARSVADALPDGELAKRSRVALQALCHARGIPLLGKEGYSHLTSAQMVQRLTDGYVDAKPVKPDSVADLRSRAIANGLGKSVAGKTDKAGLVAYVVDNVKPVPKLSMTDKLRAIAKECQIERRSKATTAHALVCLIRSTQIDADTLLAGIDESAIAKAHESRQTAKNTGLTATVCRQMIAYAIASGRISADDAKGRSAWKADQLRTFVQAHKLDIVNA